MERPFFSIVIPTYNRANFIGKTILSVLNQTYTNFELLVIDDGSTDNTQEFVNSINDKRLQYYKKENAERGAARNFGINKSVGDYITFLDSDDQFYVTHLEEAFIFINDNNPNILFQGYEIISETKKTKQIFPNKDINKLLLTFGNVMSCHGVFVKNSIAKQNLFNEDYKLSGLEDYELWLRIAAQYKIEHNALVTSCLINHTDRSVVEVNKEKLISKNKLFLQYIFQHEKSKKYCKPFKAFLISNTYSYIALHLILSGFKKNGIRYFLKSIWQKPDKLYSRRSMAIVKHFIF
ncbi:MAG: glycosyltransferase [Salinivirgaceae bacterium]|jgi:glycosyltransferase involved in cell wall biosynthesis|nr:glycosyltransferase [Salinivirgaceae bacterium]